MTADTRRFSRCLLGSLFVNGLLCLLVGRLWLPLPLPSPPTPARIRLLTFVPPPRRHLAPKRLRQIPPVPIKPVPAARHVGARRPRISPAAAPVSQAGHAGARQAARAVLQSPQVVRHALPARKVITTAAKRVVIAAPLPASLSTAGQPAIPAALPAISKAGASAGHSDSREEGNNHGAGPGTGEGTGREAGEPFGVGAGTAGDGSPRHVAYVLDISGSMTSRIDRARTEIRHALAGLGPDETFTLVAFSDQAEPFSPRLVPATPQTRTNAEEFLRRLTVEGGTNLEAALSAALHLPGVNKIVLVTDGVPTLGETDFGRLARDIRTRNTAHARIFTIGLIGKNPDGTDDSFAAAALLRQIARESDGASQEVTLGVSSP